MTRLDDWGWKDERGSKQRIFLGVHPTALGSATVSGRPLRHGQSGSQKVPGVVAAIETYDALFLFLPPSFRDLNPIEQVFSKIKNEIRRRGLSKTWKLLSKTPSTGS